VHLKNNELIHQFNPDNQKEFDEWLSILDEITELYNNKVNMSVHNTSNTSNSSDSPSKDYRALQLNNVDVNKVRQSR
jgi:hypothetical protein